MKLNQISKLVAVILRRRKDWRELQVFVLFQTKSTALPPGSAVSMLRSLFQDVHVQVGVIVRIDMYPESRFCVLITTTKRVIEKRHLVFNVVVHESLYSAFCERCDVLSCSFA